MIIWLNGAFGVGKTTTTNELKALIPDAITFDPEEIGFLLRNLIPVPTGDFQDLPSWRRLTIATIAEVAASTSGTVVVPMTLLNEKYADEIFTGLTARRLETLHVALHTNEHVLRERIVGHDLFPGDPERNSTARDWRINHLAAYNKALPWITSHAHLIDTTNLTPAETAKAILAAT